MASITLTVDNLSAVPDTEVYLGFWGASLNASINGTAMTAQSWYALSTITSFVINDTTSGRIYVAYAPNGCTINPNASILSGNDDVFDKFELTFDGTVFSCADLTAIDFWSIPMSLSTSLKKAPVGHLAGLTGTTTAADLYTALAALSDPVQSTPAAKAVIEAFAKDGNALPTGVADQLLSPASGVVTNGAGDFVRIIGPNSYPPFGSPSTDALPGLPATPYNTFLSYYDALISSFGPGTASPAPGFTSLGNGRIATIKGQFAGNSQETGPSYAAQAYDLKASIDKAGMITLAGSTGHFPSVTITIDRWNLLNPAASYGAAPAFSLNGGALQTPGNDVYGWILGDFFAGLNIGAIGSATTVKVSGSSVAVGDMASSDWFSTLPAKGLLFAALWPAGVTDHWNQWAAALNPSSQAYNFAFAERFSAPQLNLNPKTVDTLSITLLSRTVTAG
ncbi:hypothetical protein WG926_09250 [Tistrella sp. BH-R2-4]|uniref:Beta-1,3-glucanase N-terminal domain-containing protein n=1 Tax=Tistrella arctica TaxID=3133430 RepID=A0ABU9YI69_9PROT